MSRPSAPFLEATDVVLLTDLPPHYREILLQAAEHQEWSYRERAVALGLKIGTYKSRLMRAQAALRTLRHAQELKAANA